MKTKRVFLLVLGLTTCFICWGRDPIVHAATVEESQAKKSIRVLEVFADGILSPAGMALTPDGALLVVSRRQHGAVYKIHLPAEKEPGVSRIVSSADLCNPYYITVDAKGFIYVSTSRPTVLSTTRGYSVAKVKMRQPGLYRISPDGREMFRIQEIGHPTKGLAVDRDGFLYSCNQILSIEEETSVSKVAERTSDKMFGGSDDPRPYIMRCEHRSDLPANLETKIVEYLEHIPTDITFDSEGNLIYVAAHDVVKMSFGLFGPKTETIANLKVLNPHARKSTGICIDEAGNLYLGLVNPYVRAGGTVVKIDPAGNASTFAERLRMPADVLTDNAGNIYISDMKANCVFRVAAALKDNPTPFRPEKKRKPRKTAPEAPATEEVDQQETVSATEQESVEQEEVEAGIQPNESGEEQTAAEQSQAVQRDRGRSRAEELIDNAKEGNADAVADALNDGIYPDVKDHNRRTPLMLAAFEGHDEVVRILLSKGANLRARDVDGWTALMYAAYGGRTETVLLLIGEGANVNVRVKSGQSVLTIAEQKGHYDVIQVLEEAGAKR